jgi:hypothetical protein
LRIVIRGWTLTIAYSPLSFWGPSISIPSALPSAEKEWQLAQVCSPSIITRLCVAPTSRSLQAISGMACGARGLITPFSFSEGMSGTSR